MKKMITLVLAFVFIFSFGGCRDTDTATEIENIIDLTESSDIGTADEAEIFYFDETYDYRFSSIKSHYVIVYYTDGTEQNVKDALAEGKIKITDLDRFGIHYSKDPIEYILERLISHK